MSVAHIGHSNFTIVLTQDDAEVALYLLQTIRANPERFEAFTAKHRIGLGRNHRENLTDPDPKGITVIDHSVVIISGEIASSLNSLLYGIQHETTGSESLGELMVPEEYQERLSHLWETIHDTAAIV